MEGANRLGGMEHSRTRQRRVLNTEVAMLILTRWKDEAIIINGNIKVVVTEVRGDGRVNLGIEAPAGVPVHRQEVFEAIQREQNGGES